MCDYIKEKNTEAFLKEDNKNLYASEFSNISIETCAYGNVEMLHHIFSLIRMSDYGKDWCYLGKCLYYADKFYNEKMIDTVINYIEERDLQDDVMFYCEKVYEWQKHEKETDASKILLKYFDCTHLLENDWLNGEVREILEKQKLHKDLEQKLAPK